jgi:hypothetical protein
MEILVIGLLLGLVTDLHKRYLVTEVLNMWEVSMGGSHTLIQLEYLELTVQRREVGEVLVVVGRAPAC